jgi:acyl carrier protein
MTENSAPKIDLTAIQALMAEVFAVSPEEIIADLQFGDLPQWDSLGHMDLMMRLEEEFGLEMTADRIAELISVPSILAHLQAHPEENGHARQG